MTDLCIFYFHHKDDEVTRHNLEMARRFNPGAVVVPAWCNDGLNNRPLPESVKVRCPSDRGFNWHNLDLNWIEWFKSQDRVEASRYMVLESDCLCLQAASEVYEHVWDKDVVGSAVYRIQDPPPRPWIMKGQAEYLPCKWRRFAGQLMPLNGIMLSRSAISEIAALELPEGIHCELRLGTAARVAGYDLTALPAPHCLHNVAPGVRPLKVSASGMWHPVKTIINPA